LLLAFHGKYVPILHHFCDIVSNGQKSPILTYPTCIRHRQPDRWTNRWTHSYGIYCVSI